MQSGEDNIKRTVKNILRQMQKMQAYYHKLIFSGIGSSILLCILAYKLINSWWGRSLVIWISLCLLVASGWIYLKAYRELQQEIYFYNDILGIRIQRRRLPPIRGLNYIWRMSGNLYFLSFSIGLLLSLLIVDDLEDRFENSFFNTLGSKVVGDRPSIPEDSTFIRSVHLTHDLLNERTAIFNNDIEASWLGTYIHPVSLDLISANGACGSYSVVLCRILQSLNYKTRLLQMNDRKGQVCHIVVEVKSTHGWVVLDPLYNLYFRTPSEHLASFDDVSRTWEYYRTQVPANYDLRYNYAGARYTNWNKIPVVMPFLKMVLGIFMDKESLEHFSLRVYFLRKYKAMEIIYLLILILAFCRLLTRLTRVWDIIRPRRLTLIIRAAFLISRSIDGSIKKPLPKL